MSIFITICVPVFFLWVVSQFYPYVLSNYFLSTLNRFEAKLARLEHRACLVGNLDVHFLSNTRKFTQDKEVLVLVHGFSADKYVWNRFAKKFTHDYQLIIPDLKGHGQTEYRASDSYSATSHYDILTLMLRELGIASFTIIGNSMGGLVAAKFLDKEPERINKCVLIDPGGARSAYALEMIAQDQNPFAHKKHEDFFHFYKLAMAKPPYVPKFILRAMAQSYIDKRDQHEKMFKDYYDARDFFPIGYRFKHKDTMLIWGMNDQVLSVEDYQIWKSMLDSSTEIYEDLGHLPMLEDVNRVSKDVKRFLQNPISSPRSNARYSD